MEVFREMLCWKKKTARGFSAPNNGALKTAFRFVLRRLGRETEQHRFRRDPSREEKILGQEIKINNRGRYTKEEKKERRIPNEVSSEASPTTRVGGEGERVVRGGIRGLPKRAPQTKQLRYTFHTDPNIIWAKIKEDKSTQIRITIGSYNIESSQRRGAKNDWIQNQENKL